MKVQYVPSCEKKIYSNQFLKVEQNQRNKFLPNNYFYQDQEVIAIYLFKINYFFYVCIKNCNRYFWFYSSLILFNLKKKKFNCTNFAYQLIDEYIKI